jgi:hypothetical protein
VLANVECNGISGNIPGCRGAFGSTLFGFFRGGISCNGNKDLTTALHLETALASTSTKQESSLAALSFEGGSISPSRN